MTHDDTLVVTPEALEEMLDRAAERGAKRALEGVGLHDDKAGKDISDLRDLIEGWREVKRGALRSIGKTIGMAILIGLAVLAGKHIPWSN